MRPKWAHGRNYDSDLLKIYTNESGFILGVSKLGDRLGVDGADVEIPAEFTSINISHNCSVESGLFVHKEVSVCTLTATMPEHIDLMKKRLSVTYDGEILFKGTVQDVSWTESVDTRYWLPGNTATKSYEVSLLVTAGDEAFSDAVTPPKNFSTTQVEGRVGEWLGLTVDASKQDPADDLGRDLYDNIMRFISDYVVINASDDMGSLADTLRDALKLTNMHFVYEPWNSTVRVINNNRWHSGDDESNSIIFTDEPVADSGTDYLHSGRYIDYGTREFGYEPGFYQGSVRIQTNFGGEEVFGPYRANEVNPADVLVDLGKQSVDGGDSLARNYVSTLPLKRSSEPFTKSITVPLQSYYQLYTEWNQVPGMALLKHDGITEKVAVLGMAHNITPSLWTVTYTLGPRHLLDRESDFDPSLPKGLTFIDDGAVTGTVRFNFITPETRPTDVNLYAYVYTSNSPNKNDISWTSSIVVRLVTSIDSYGDEEVMPTSVTYFSTGRPTTPGTYFYYLAVTSDPSPGSGVVNHQYRQSQPVFIGTVVVT
jgi:hypothetical protein